MAKVREIEVTERGGIQEARLGLAFTRNTLVFSRRSMLVMNKLILISFVFIFILLGPMAFSTVSSGIQSDATKGLKRVEQTEHPVQESNKVTANKKPDTERSFLDILEKILKIAAYIIGALWVYFNYFKGRTYRPRLETNLEGELLNIGSTAFVKIVLEIKNVGLSKINIEQEGTAIRILTFNPSKLEDPWEHQRTISVLSVHKWIEPGETVKEHNLIPLLSKDIIAVRGEVIIVSTKTMWETVAILTNKKSEV